MIQGIITAIAIVVAFWTVLDLIIYMLKKAPRSLTITQAGHLVGYAAQVYLVWYFLIS